MTFWLALAALVSVVLSGPVHQGAPEDDIGVNMQYFLVETSPGVFEVEDLVHAEVEPRASASDVVYHFFSRNNPSRGTDITSTNLAALRNTEFSAAKETLFIVHGWRNSRESPVNHHIREAILSRHDINVFIVDWSPIAGRSYMSAQGSVTDVGRFVASFLQSLVSTYGVQLGRVAFVGHSLGAHVAGNAGAALNGHIDHIVGLDPALPLFSINNIHNRLDPSDARFVQIIHTNGGLLGFAASIGHSDYFPNGGRSQPGCGLDIAGTCAHSRAYFYYAEAIESARNLFVSTRCGSYTDYTRGRCSGNDRSPMGGYTIDTRAFGDYYLTTNSRAPFARG